MEEAKFLKQLGNMKDCIIEKQYVELITFLDIGEKNDKGQTYFMEKNKIIAIGHYNDDFMNDKISLVYKN